MASDRSFLMRGPRDRPLCVPAKRSDQASARYARKGAVYPAAPRPSVPKTYLRFLKTSGSVGAVNIWKTGFFRFCTTKGLSELSAASRYQAVGSFASCGTISKDAEPRSVFCDGALAAM